MSLSTSLIRHPRWAKLIPTPSPRHYSATPTSTPWSAPPSGTAVYTLLSGGVDSSVAAVLLQQAGYSLRPIFMRNWDTLDEDLPGSGGCEWERDWEDVQRLCVKSLGGVEPELVDLRKEYWAEVFDPALSGWGRGVTPNPDVGCNREIKFGALPTKLLARSPSAWLATGHYARLLPSTIDPSRPALHRASFLPKDQSYYLSTSSLSVLGRTLFPLGAMRKDDVRRLAREHGLPTSERKESMGICFVGTRKRFGSFLGSYLNPSPGEIQLPGGKVVGKHEGLWRSTIGEGARISGLPEKHYVARKDTHRNVVVVAPAGHSMLQTTALATSDFKWADGAHPPSAVDEQGGLRVQAQTRSLQEGSIADCAVRRRPDGSLAIELLSTLVGVAPGQNVVLYDGTWCLGGGTIESTRTLWDAEQDGASATEEAAPPAAERGFPEFAPAEPVVSTVMSEGGSGYPIEVRTKMYEVPSFHDRTAFQPPVTTRMYEVPSFHSN